jgi:hypothetical protein
VDQHSHRHAASLRALGWTAGLAGVAALTYATQAGLAWFRYGHPAAPGPDEADCLLDHFMPDYEVVERHRVRVLAPAGVTLDAAMTTDMQASPIVRAIFRARELVLGASAETVNRPQGLLAQVQALGWRVLAETPGREIVVGAVTQPWMPDVTFRGLDPEAFRAFHEPGYVKIAWTLRADPDGPDRSVFRTETRVATTDATSRAKFRAYWARFSAGIILIRRLMLRDLKVMAERRGGGSRLADPQASGR